MNYISFPGLGIDFFKVNQSPFSIAGREIRWYGIIICIGIILGFLVFLKNAKYHGINTDTVLDFAIILIPVSIIGARLYYVITSLSEYNSFYEVIAIWNGGLAIYGAIIAGAIATFIVCKVKKISYILILDCLSVGVILGQCIGRWGNFFNAEAYGSIMQYDFFGKTFDISASANSFPLRMVINSIPDFTNATIAHPTFLYESIWNLLGFILLTILFKKTKFKGQIFLTYITWYGFGRCIIEGFRTDSLWVGNFRISQLLATLCFIIGIILLTVLFLKNKKQKEYINTPIKSQIKEEEQTNDNN